MVSLHPVLFADIHRKLSRYCPDVDFGVERAEMIDWLSMYRVTFLPIRSGVVWMSHKARIAPTASAS